MPKTIVKTALAPAAIGPYSQAVRAGDFLFVSGQIPLLPADGVPMPQGIRDQTRQALTNLKEILGAAGAGLEDVVKTTVYMKDLAQFKDMNEVYAEFFPVSPPARATVEVSRLPRDVLVEVDAVALLG